MSFGRLISSDSSESNLYAIAGSSSVAIDAVKKGNLSQLLEGVAVIYGTQEIYSDASHSLELKKKGVNELSLYIDCSFNSTLNLIPIDYAVNTLIELVKLHAENKIYNITHPYPPRVSEMIEDSLAVLGIRGIRLLLNSISISKVCKFL